MTAQLRATLKAYFETGDVPTSAQYVDVMDSFLSLVEPGAQVMVSPLILPAVSAISVNVQSLSVTSTADVSGVARFQGHVSADAGLTVSGAVTAKGSLLVAGTFTCQSSARIKSFVEVSGGLRVLGHTSVDAGMTVSAAMTAKGTLTVIGSADIGILSVAGTAYLGGPLTYVSGQLAVAGISTVADVVVAGFLRMASAQTTASATAGPGRATPASVARMLKIIVSASTFVIPLFKIS